MKKIFLIISILFFSISMKSQITKGYWMLGGDANFHYGKTIVEGIGSSDSQSFIIRPQLGYFIKDKVALGLISEFYFSNEGNSKSAYLNPFVRYYFLDTEKKLNIFSEASFAYQVTVYKNSDDKPISKGYSFKSGLVYFVNDVVGLEFSVKYTKGKFNNSNDIVHGIKAGFGLQIHLEKKQ